MTEFLRKHNAQRSVVLLDEFEKFKGLHSSLGWAQDKKMYQSFLEPWQEGVITDRGEGQAGRKIDCSKTIFLLTTNIGQEEIIKFYNDHVRKMESAELQSEEDVEWIQKELVDAKLGPLLRAFFQGIASDLSALYRRIDGIVPFLPFSKPEREVVADSVLRGFFAPYREPPRLDGPKELRRPIGSVLAHVYPELVSLTAGAYEEMDGAPSMHKVARRCRNEMVDL